MRFQIYHNSEGNVSWQESPMNQSNYESVDTNRFAKSVTKLTEEE